MWTNKLAEFFFPPKCVFCGRALCGDEKDVCETCGREVRGVAHPAAENGRFYKSAAAVYAYEGKVRRAVHGYKFRGQRSSARHFGRVMAELWQRKNIAADIITSPPSSKLKTFKKGYDHAWELALEMSRYCGVPAARLLKKIRKTQPMYGLRPEQRRANVLGSVGLCCKKQDIRDKVILLADDVLTTGSTASECARILMQNGAKSVYVITAAAKK